ncbi:DUF2262 domain-containing protein, partial [Gemmata sp. JC673]
EAHEVGEAFEALAWDDHLEWWKGAAEFGPGRRIDLHVEAGNDPAAFRVAVVRARPMWDRLRASEQTVREVVAGQLTAAHNEFCDPEDEVTEAQFAERMRLLSVRFKVTGVVELVFADRSLLGGHWIVVPVEADGAVGEVITAG